MTPETAADRKGRRTLRHLIPPGRTREYARRYAIGVRQLRGVITGERPASLDLAVRIAADHPGQVSIEELTHTAIPPGVAVRRADVRAA